MVVQKVLMKVNCLVNSLLLYKTLVFRMDVREFTNSRSGIFHIIKETVYLLSNWGKKCRKTS